MKKTTSFSIIAYFLLILTSCKKDEQKTLPILTSTDATSITATSVFVGGNVTSDGGAKITVRGVCWRTSSNPTTGDSITKDGSGIGKFTSNLNGLSPGITYYVRAYATNSVGTAYGNSVTFTTKFAKPTVTTTTLPILTSSSVESGGIITSDGGQPITSRGVCWSTSHIPTIIDNITSDGAGIGSFSSQLISLYPGATYYLCAYASNKAGTGYGNALCFVLDADGNLYHTITIGNQLWMVENLKTTHYSYGTPIPNVSDNTQWGNLTSGAYCDYNNDATNATIYGHLYNWYAVDNIDKLAPYGWHVPAEADWKTLKNFLGGSYITGGKIKEIGTTHWNSPNTGATNESGFCALPGGQRITPWISSGLGYKAFFWTSSDGSQTTAIRVYLGWDNSNIDYSGYSYYTSGFSVRCVRDQF